MPLLSLLFLFYKIGVTIAAFCFVGYIWDYKLRSDSRFFSSQKELWESVLFFVILWPMTFVLWIKAWQGQID